MKQKGERQKQGDNQHKRSSDRSTTLADLGISKQQSSDWQKLAAIPEKQFEAQSWLPWLNDNFGWSRQTADRFMSVAQAFSKMLPVSNLDGLSIDARALPPSPLRRRQATRGPRGGEVTMAANPANQEHLENFLARFLGAAILWSDIGHRFTYGNVFMLLHALSLYREIRPCGEENGISY